MDLEQWNRVRHRVLVKKESKRSVMACEGLHYETLQRMLTHSFPPGYKRREYTAERKITPHLEWINEVLENPHLGGYAAKKQIPIINFLFLFDFNSLILLTK